jgi:hypothetical protein
MTTRIQQAGGLPMAGDELHGKTVKLAADSRLNG